MRWMYQLLLVRPRGAVDTLQLLVLGVAAPIGARDAGQLERFQEARIGHVRTAAHVHVFLVVVQAHCLLVRHVFDQAKLVVLAAGLEDLDDLGARRHFLDDIVVLGNQRLHALLDRGQVVRGKRALAVNVVVEAFRDDRTDHHLHVRVQLLDRVPDQVGAGMADDFQAFLVLGRDDAQPGVVVDNVAGIHQLAVHFTGQGRLGQTGADGLRHLHDGNGVFEFSAAAVGKRDGDHGLKPGRGNGE
jgi:hypothetical protein